MVLIRVDTFFDLWNGLELMVSEDYVCLLIQLSCKDLFFVSHVC